MSAFPTNAAERFTGLREIQVSSIDANPENPRLIFPQEELDRLAESIANEGVLVPIVVYPDGDRYILIDGERRVRCSQLLGLQTIPAVITEPKTSRDNLVQMFNIHLVREPWRDMPTAWALDKLITDLSGEQDGSAITDAQLSDLTGLSRERIARLRHALELPREYQEYINEGIIPLNWFWELKRNVVEPLSKQRPAIFGEYGRDGVTNSFVRKRLDGLIRDTVSLRDVRPIINFAQRDAESSGGLESVLDDTIRGLIEDPQLTIEVAYEDTVQIMVEADKLDRRTRNMLTSFQRLLERVRTDDERDHVIRIGKEFTAAMHALLGA
jgi:ParB family chromosome partitioning protein